MSSSTEINTTKFQQNSRIRAAPVVMGCDPALCLMWLVGRAGTWTWAKEGMVISPFLLLWGNLIFFFGFCSDSIHYSWRGHEKLHLISFCLDFLCLCASVEAASEIQLPLFIWLLFEKAYRFWTLLCLIFVSSSLRSAGIHCITLAGWLPINIYQMPFRSLILLPSDTFQPHAAT